MSKHKRDMPPIGFCDEYIASDETSETSLDTCCSKVSSQYSPPSEERGLDSNTYYPFNKRPRLSKRMLGQELTFLNKSYTGNYGIPKESPGEEQSREVGLEEKVEEIIGELESWSLVDLKKWRMRAMTNLEISENSENTNNRLLIDKKFVNSRRKEMRRMLLSAKKNEARD